MSDRAMSDEEAADFYAETDNQGFDATRVVRGRPLSGSIPVRFPPKVIAQVQAAADSEGVTVSAWVRNAVADALTRTVSDTTAIADQLEGLARQLRHSA
jgi:predicted HicB family RNase H-like nuclease